MKKIFVLSMLVVSGMLCSCQKQDSSAEAQLTQRKTELDAREETLIQREKAVEEREKAVVERERAVASSRVVQPQRRAPDAAQAEAERQKRIQQLPPELRALIPDRSRIDAARSAKDPGAGQEQPIQSQRSLEEARKKKMSSMAVPAQETPEADNASESASPTP